jgi:hypothetical protein
MDASAMSMVLCVVDIDVEGLASMSVVVGTVFGYRTELPLSSGNTANKWPGTGQDCLTASSRERFTPLEPRLGLVLSWPGERQIESGCLRLL